MVANVNEVRLIGHLGQDPELNKFPSGDPYTTAVLITNKRVKDRQTGELKEFSQSHRIVCRGANAEFVAQYLKSGAYVYFQGELRHRSYEVNGETRWISEVYGTLEPLTKKATAGASVRVPDDFGGDDDIPQ